jgi:hypothetical protein
MKTQLNQPKPFEEDPGYGNYLQLQRFWDKPKPAIVPPRVLWFPSTNSNLEDPTQEDRFFNQHTLTTSHSSQTQEAEFKPYIVKESKSPDQEQSKEETLVRTRFLPIVDKLFDSVSTKFTAPNSEVDMFSSNLETPMILTNLASLGKFLLFKMQDLLTNFNPGLILNILWQILSAINSILFTNS